MAIQIWWCLSGLPRRCPPIKEEVAFLSSPSLSQTTEEGTSPLISFPSPNMPVEKDTFSLFSSPHPSPTKEGVSYTLFFSNLDATEESSSDKSYSSDKSSLSDESSSLDESSSSDEISTSPLFSSRLSPTKGEVGSANFPSPPQSNEEGVLRRRLIACTRCRRLKKKVS